MDGEQEPTADSPGEQRAPAPAVQTASAHTRAGGDPDERPDGDAADGDAADGDAADGDAADGERFVPL